MSLISQLIERKTANILRVFAINKKKELYLSEISKKANVPIASTFRILKKLCKIKIIEEFRVSKFTFYRLPKNSKIKRLFR